MVALHPSLAVLWQYFLPWALAGICLDFGWLVGVFCLFMDMSSFIAKVCVETSSLLLSH